MFSSSKSLFFSRSTDPILAAISSLSSLFTESSSKLFSIRLFSSSTIELFTLDPLLGLLKIFSLQLLHFQVSISILESFLNILSGQFKHLEWNQKLQGPVHKIPWCLTPIVHTPQGFLDIIITK